MEIASCGKRIKEIAKELGDKYCLKVIDCEWCVYRDLKNGYDIEVSGLNNRRKTMNATVYVWRTKEYCRIVDTAKNITSIEQLKQTLEEIEEWYKSGEYPITRKYPLPAYQA